MTSAGRLGEANQRKSRDRRIGVLRLAFPTFVQSSKRPIERLRCPYSNAIRELVYFSVENVFPGKISETRMVSNAFSNLSIHFLRSCCERNERSFWGLLSRSNVSVDFEQSPPHSRLPIS